MPTLSNVASRSPKIAVIGAGMAGLRCADVLLRAGMNVTVLEGRDRIGGRCHQLLNGGHLVDMGPNWIHGPVKGNPIRKVAERTKTVYVELDDEGGIIDSDGNRIPNALVGETGKTMFAALAEAFKYSAENSGTIKKDENLMEYLKQIYNREVKDAKERNLVIGESQLFGHYTGDTVETQSLKFAFLEGGTAEGGNAFVASTYSQILKEVGRPVLERANVQFNTEVVNIDWTGQKYSLIEQNDADQANALSDSKIILTTKQGQRLDFDEVVITTPLGWLKQNKATAFSPALPSRLSEAVDSINYGRLEKVYISFPSAFWHTPSTNATSESISDQSSEPTAEPWPQHVHFHDPSYTSHPVNAPMNQATISHTHFPDNSSHPTLLFYMYGPFATYIVDHISSLPEHSNAYNQFLTSHFEPFYRRISNYNPHNPECVPTSFLMTKWQADHLAGNGSYSNFRIGLERGDEDIKVMRDAGGLSLEHGLWMAGEHTAPFSVIATTTGAFWSGEAVAKKICHKYGVKYVKDWIQEECERELIMVRDDGSYVMEWEEEDEKQEERH